MPADLGPINAATPTPLKVDGSLDCVSARRLARRWIDIRLDGVLLLGSMGEGRLLAGRDRDGFVEIALEEAGDRLTLFASAADSSRERMREQAARYAAMGAPYVVLCLPPGVSAARAIADVKAVAESCTVPCCYYDVPAVTGAPLNLEQLRDLLSHPNIVALKDSSNNPLLSQALTAPEYRVPGVKIFDGVEYRTAWSRAVGYDGVVHGGAALTGRRVRAIWEEPDPARASALDRENSLFLGTIYNRFSQPLQNTVGQKYVLKLLGVLEGEAVAVDQALDDASRVRIAAAVERSREWLEPCAGQS
jgi:dihydrodipicolinate synthase/N-acetylneuraminate lyase